MSGGLLREDRDLALVFKIAVGLALLTLILNTIIAVMLTVSL